jgi:hypothetical protein
MQASSSLPLQLIENILLFLLYYCQKARLTLTLLLPRQQPFFCRRSGCFAALQSVSETAWGLVIIAPCSFYGRG